MSYLAAIVKATRASASALSTVQTIARLLLDKSIPEEHRKILEARKVNAERRYERAQAVLAANPLPGDAS